MKKIKDPLVELTRYAINSGIKVKLNNNGITVIYNNNGKNFVCREETKA